MPLACLWRGTPRSSPRPGGEKPLSDYGNLPLRGRLYRRLVPSLRRHLAEQLPDYMIPAGFVVLERLPLSANGKVDRKALATLADGDRSSDAPFVAPRNASEETLAKIWAELLGVSRVGIHDDFFELGGHSLLATRVVSRVRDGFGVELPLQTLFEARTVAALAAAVVERQAAAADDATLAEMLAEIRELDPEQVAALLAAEQETDGEAPR